MGGRQRGPWSPLWKGVLLSSIKRYNRDTDVVRNSNTNGPQVFRWFLRKFFFNIFCSWLYVVRSSLCMMCGGSGRAKTETDCVEILTIVNS